MLSKKNKKQNNTNKKHNLRLVSAFAFHDFRKTENMLYLFANSGSYFERRQQYCTVGYRLVLEIVSPSGFLIVFQLYYEMDVK